MVTATLASVDTLTRGGGGGGWTSLHYPWMVTVTLASADTLTRGGGRRVDIPGLSMDGHCYTGVCGYSDKGGGCKGGHSLTIQGWSQLLPAKYKATVSIHG